VNGQPEDRRVRRTRRLLQEALLALLREKGYDKVTVRDLLDRADLGRATFYAHFRDKDDLLVSSFRDVRETLRQRLAALAGAQPRGPTAGAEVLRALFEHAAGQRGLYRAVIGERGSAAVLRDLREQLAGLLREHLEQAAARRGVPPVVPPEVTVQVLVGALLGALTWWLDADSGYTAEQMDRMFTRRAAPLIEAGLGPVPAAPQHVASSDRGRRQSGPHS
jgi:AcrR family transcriptional regulator